MNKPATFGVFHHEPGLPTRDMYRAERAVKVFARESAADKYARANNLVVRAFDINGFWVIR